MRFAWVVILSAIAVPLASRGQERLDLAQPRPLAGRVFFPDAPAGPLPLAPSQLMIAAYYQMKLADGCFFQTTLTDIPTPGMNPSIPNALAITFRLILLF
jgi:hypothetical protein